MEEKFEEKLVTQRYKKEFFAGIVGIMQGPLWKTESYIRHRFSGIETAPVKNHAEMEFLATFIFDPVIDLTFDQYDSYRSSIVGYSLNEEALRRTIEEMAQTINLVPLRASQKIKKTWEIEFQFEKKSYQDCEFLASHFAKPFEKTWGAVRYINFLKMYKNISMKEAEYLTREKFQIPLS